jgi:hypothetical protein
MSDHVAAFASPVICSIGLAEFVKPSNSAQTGNLNTHSGFSGVTVDSLYKSLRPGLGGRLRFEKLI